MTDFSSAAKVLVVDDEQNIVIAVEFLMKQQGFITETAFNGEDALAKALDFDPDVIVLDVMMPLMDGFGVAKAFRERRPESAAKIVFLTAKGTPRDIMEGYGSGGDIFLTKPFDNHELVSTISELIEFERS